MWQINYTVLIKVILDELRRVALGELFDDLNLGVTDAIRNCFGIPTESDEDEQQHLEQESGEQEQEEINILDRIGLTQITLFCILVLLASMCYLLVRLNRKYKWGIGQSALDAINKKLSRNTAITYFYYNWIKIGYATAPVAISFVTGSERNLQSLISLIAFTLQNVILPVLFVITLIRNYDNLPFEETKAKIGVLYSNVSLLYHDGGKKLTLRRKDIVMYPLIFCVRRTMFVLTCVIWIEYPAIQLVVHFATTTFYFMHLSRDGLFRTKC